MPTKVLVFESDAAFAAELRTELGKLGCISHVVDDGNLGLQVATADPPNLILLSIELPRMNGFSVCNKLKKDPNLKDVPLIIMSSESSEETFEQHKKLRTRAEDYVHKPIAFGELRRHIETFVRLEGESSVEPIESAIVIDDDLEGPVLEMEEETHADTRGADAGVSRETESLGAADDELDAFTDMAFGRLTGETAAAPPPRAERAEPPRAPSVAPPPRARTPRPPPPPVPVAAAAPPPPPGPRIDPSELEEARRDAEAQRRRAQELEATLAQTTSRIEALEAAADRVATLEAAAARIPALEAAASRVETLEAAAGRVQGLEAAVAAARADVDALRLQADEAERLQREVEELRGRLAAAARPGASPATSREFLDLREALNRKDKEILSLKEAVTSKEKAILDAQDRTLALERQVADFEDKVVQLEQELGTARARVENVTAERETHQRAAEDLRGRLARTESDLETSHRELAEARARHGEELAARDAKEAALVADHAQAVQRRDEEHARALEQAEAARRADQEQARRDREAAVEELREALTRDKNESVARLQTEADAKVTALSRAHQEELTRTKREADAREEDVRRDAAARAEELRTALERERDERLAALRTELEQAREAALARAAEERASAVADVEARAARDLEAARGETRAAVDAGNQRAATLEQELANLRQELAALRDAKAASEASSAAEIRDLEARARALEDARALLDGELHASRERVGVLEQTESTLRAELSVTKDELTRERQRGERAAAKWEADRVSLDRAKDALAIALAQIEEAEGRSLP